MVPIGGALGTSADAGHPMNAKERIETLQVGQAAGTTRPLRGDVTGQTVVVTGRTVGVTG